MYIYVNTLVCIVLQYPGKLGLYMDLSTLLLARSWEYRTAWK